MKAQRKTLKLSQRAVGEAVGRDRSTVASWELGRQRPDLEVIPQLAEVLQVSIEALLGPLRPAPDQETPTPAHPEGALMA